jgi:hypothetical protein
MSTLREELHQLLEALPEEELGQVRDFLKLLLEEPDELTYVFPLTPDATWQELDPQFWPPLPPRYQANGSAPQPGCLDKPARDARPRLALHTGGGHVPTHGRVARVARSRRAPAEAMALGLTVRGCAPGAPAPGPC